YRTTYPHWRHPPHPPTAGWYRAASAGTSDSRPPGTLHEELSCHFLIHINRRVPKGRVDLLVQLFVGFSRRDIVSDGRAVSVGRMGIVAELVKHPQPRTEKKTFLDIVGDHKNGHAGFTPDVENEPVHVCTNTGIQRTKRFIQ